MRKGGAAPATGAAQAISAKGPSSSLFVTPTLEEKHEFFEISSSGAKYTFVNNIDDPLHANWLCVCLCSVLISSTGHSHTLDSLHEAIMSKGISATCITKQKLAKYLVEQPYIIKHERYVKPSPDTTRYSLNHRMVRPGVFLHDLRSFPVLAADEKLKEDGALFILSSCRGGMTRDGGGEITTGEVLFKDFQRLMKECLALDVPAPGKVIKPINLRTKIIKYVPGDDGISVKKETMDGIAIVKSEARDKSVRYKFAPSTAARW